MSLIEDSGRIDTSKSQIGLFESIEQNAVPFEPYDITWNSEVTWGTKQQPLIVKTLIGTNRNGECYVRLCVCECAFADEIC